MSFSGSVDVNYIDELTNRPAIGVYEEGMSIRAVLEKAYIPPVFYLNNLGEHRSGIDNICKDFGDKSLLFIGPGGSGKTTAFLHLVNNNDSYNHENRRKFYYITVSALNGLSNKLSDYEKSLRSKINRRQKVDGIILLDGLEEAYIDDAYSAGKKLKRIIDAGNTVWVACRYSFYEKFDIEIRNLFEERLSIEEWTEHDVNLFVDGCLKNNKNKESIKNRISRFNIEKENSLLHRPLFATMMLFIAQTDEISSVSNEYELTQLFIQKWMDREFQEKHAKKNESLESICDVALKVFLNKKPKYDEKLEVFRDLLVMPNRDNIIHAFYHREFLVFFIAHAIIDAAKDNPSKIVWWFTQTFYNDITSFFKPALSQLDSDEVRRISANLFNVYKRSYEDPRLIEDEFATLKLITKNSSKEDCFLKLRDEILYFYLRVPGIDYQDFVKYAYEKSTDIMLNLGIAYGMARIEPNNKYTLEFAKKLVPGSPEEKRNRGWGVCFFNDVAGNGYTFEDGLKYTWKNVRENRLARLIDDENKYHTRILDLPLLYCFYFSRRFVDCNSAEDLAKIEKCNIDMDVYGDEQKIFLKEKKDELVSVYLSHLAGFEVDNDSTLLDYNSISVIGMAEGDNKVKIEVDEKTIEVIRQHSKLKEEIHKNISSFWKCNGDAIIRKYSEYLVMPQHKNISEDIFENKLKSCKVLVISANSVEGSVLTHKFMSCSKKERLDYYVENGCAYQFATINSHQILHIWPDDIGSYTLYGSLRAIFNTLKKVTPKYIFSVGVAFGVDPCKQSLGDVLVSKELCFYDSYNKITDRKMKISPHSFYRIDPNLAVRLKGLDLSTPDTVGSFNWYFGGLLTGGTVLSDISFKEMLLEAASSADIIGGEMEAGGIYHACQVLNEMKVPFIVIKGICDWGAEKNSWNDILNENTSKINYKDCVQAFACDNAFSTLVYILSQLDL